MLRAVGLVVLLAFLVGACTTVRETNPPRTATEELLISTAADRAAERLAPAIPPGTKVFVDASYLDGTDAKYATAVLHDRLLRLGVHLMPDRKSAEMVVELRSGALSINEHSFLIGIPSFPIPIPLAGTVEFPEIALYKRVEREGIAKFAATGYDAKSGGLKDSAAAQFGLSHDIDWVLLFFIDWHKDDMLPKDNE
ncbi:MAG TPA: DUF6655 family protein [Candidatus Sulfotelmatobacter sp.]|nr:DUF6655 family protein [Candidatus Sulfotelmatobacter sp.]